MVDPDADPPLVPPQVIDPLGDRLAQLLVRKVLGTHLLRHAASMPLPPRIAEIPDQFLLLRIHRDDRLPRLLKGTDLLVDVLELGVAIRVVFAFPGLPVRLEAVADLLEQATDRVVADPMAQSAEFVGQVARALGGPKQGGFGITTGRGFEQRAEVVEQLGIGLCRRGRPAPGLRIRPGGGGIAGCRSSAIADRIVVRERPVALVMAEAPPQPRASTSVAAQRRRMRSSMRGAST